jgi:hypothetical protein
MTGSPDNTLVAPAATKRRPPAAGQGRKKGVPNKTTVAVKAAMQAVYADLQAQSGKDHGHFAKWAEENPTEFYKLWSKMLPTEVSGPDGAPIATRSVDGLAALPKDKRDAIRAAITQAIQGEAQ